MSELDPQAIYAGSDGAATRALYAALTELGLPGVVALNLFRACKCSERAKVYRGGIRGLGSYKNMAYDRKQWSMDNLCQVLSQYGDNLGIRWGWKEDPAQAYHKWVLYVDIPSGQVSFHTDRRGQGPDYPGEWDGIRGVSARRIVDWTRALLEAERQAA